MWSHTSKEKSESGFVISLNTYSKRIYLSYDADKCVGCGMCVAACPKDAIKLVSPQTIMENLKLERKVDLIEINEDKCVECGVCAATCMFNAIKMKYVNTVDHTENLEIPIVQKKGYPLLHSCANIDLDKTTYCGLCEKICPMNAIKVVKDETITVDCELCVGCNWCASNCPKDAITVNKIFSGSISIDNSKCPPDCENCALICPCDAIYSKKTAEVKFTPLRRNVIEKKIMKNKIPDGKVVLEEFCILCGACKQVCPVKDALEIRREITWNPNLKSKKLWDKVKEKLEHL
ncbi:MAG: 4Fe-4S binding protein [Candidatus Odinarchaeia archaeon]